MCTPKHNNNNSVQFFIIYVPSQQPQGQLQTEHSTDIHNYIMDTNKQTKQNPVALSPRANYTD
jgi:hypothetical protein